MRRVKLSSTPLDPRFAPKYWQGMATVPPPQGGQSGISELHLYYGVVGLYFFAFGMQFVLFPSLVTFILHATPAGIGLAQSALSAPLFCLLLFGGLFAERARAGPALAVLHGAFALTAFGLSATIATGALTYALLIAYAIIVGCCAAFMMPVRDAALNGVVERELACGRRASIATAAALTTAVQIGAQIAGIVIASAAGANPAPYLALQGLVLALGGVLCLGLKAPKPTGHERTLQGALRDMGDGLKYAFRDPIMSPMLISAAYVGVFVIGSFQVLFPLIVRESYGGDMQMRAMGTLFACFWGASFVSAVILSRGSPLQRPGRALIVSHLIGAVALATLAFDKPFSVFLAIVIGWGLAAGVAISMSRTIVQGATGPRYLGRVLAVYSMGFMGGAPIGSALVGFAASHWGARAAALAPAIGLGVAALALAVLTPLWNYAPTHATVSSDD